MVKILSSCAIKMMAEFAKVLRRFYPQHTQVEELMTKNYFLYWTASGFQCGKVVDSNGQWLREKYCVKKTLKILGEWKFHTSLQIYVHTLLIQLQYKAKLQFS